MTIVAIHSFRGGTGKSNVTANVATTMAGRGKRVGIIDTDIQSPGIHALFGLDEDSMGRSLNDYLWGRCSIEEAAHDVGAGLRRSQGRMDPVDGAMYLVPSSIKASEIARVLREGYDVEHLNDGFHELIERMDLEYLFIDTHPGLNDETLLSITVADVLLLVLRPDSQDYQGTAVTVEVARKLEVPTLLLLINKALPAFDFVALRQKAEQTYQAEVAGILPLDEDLVRLASSAVFCVRNPEHAWTREVQRIAERLTV